jgi:hypothetical protein
VCSQQPFRVAERAHEQYQHRNAASMFPRPLTAFIGRRIKWSCLVAGDIIGKRVPSNICRCHPCQDGPALPRVRRMGHRSTLISVKCPLQSRSSRTTIALIKKATTVYFHPTRASRYRYEVPVPPLHRCLSAKPTPVMPAARGVPLRCRSSRHGLVTPHHGLLARGDL